MKEIQLRNSPLKAIIDDDDFECVSQYKWTLQSGGYVRTFVGKSVLYLHRLVMGASGKLEIDHIDRNKLDCRKSNLRFATRTQNSANKDCNKGNPIKVKGVRWDDTRNKYLARIGYDGITKNLGRYVNLIDAARAYNEAAIRIYGEYANINNLEAL